jgi:hypothetical protein
MASLPQESRDKDHTPERPWPGSRKLAWILKVGQDTESLPGSRKLARIPKVGQDPESWPGSRKNGQDPESWPGSRKIPRISAS